MEFKRHESVKLVRDYLLCIDELTTLHWISCNTFDTLKDMSAKIIKEEKLSKPDNLGGESAKDRVDWAMSITKADKEKYEELLNDLRLSLTAVSAP